MRTSTIRTITFLTLSAILLCGCADENLDIQQQATPAPRPQVLGYGQGRFELGKLLYGSNFNDPQNWHIQIQQKEGYPPAMSQFMNNKLDLLMPGRGCTAWFKKKLDGPVTIIYEVVCPQQSARITGVQVRDINNFWMASDPEIAGGLFNDERYSGAFFDYHKIKCYYASTGGGGAQGNQTTRFRIYPRTVDGEDVRHVALEYRDRQPGYLITPGKKHTVQLVAFNDIIQYIVDGKVVYEIKNGDRVDVQKKTEDGIVVEQALYDTSKEQFPLYSEGYFGFRMVASHHIYSNFRVYRLNAAK